MAVVHQGLNSSHTRNIAKMTTQDKRSEVRTVMHVPSMNGRSAPKIKQSHTQETLQIAAKYRAGQAQ
jgi:hypothetical protein